jgi:hypothetical protein
MTPEDRARADIVDYCLAKRDRWHGYDAIPGQVDHDLANAYASVAEALTEQQPKPDAWEGDVMSPATQRFLADSQPEPVSRAELTKTVLGFNTQPHTLLDILLSHYTITRKPQGDPDV